MLKVFRLNIEYKNLENDRPVIIVDFISFNDKIFEIGDYK